MSLVCKEEKCTLKKKHTNPNRTVLVLGLFSDLYLVLPSHPHQCSKLLSPSQAMFLRLLSRQREALMGGWKHEAREFYFHFRRVALGNVSAKGSSISHAGLVHCGPSCFQVTPGRLMPPSPLVPPT